MNLTKVQKAWRQNGRLPADVKSVWGSLEVTKNAKDNQSPDMASNEIELKVMQPLEFNKTKG
jgi:hypothetical protein